jgi:putative zinc finger/helix-turn-helix YgiT family protein
MKTKKCEECGCRMTVSRENYKYDISGLPNVTLVGIEVGRCDACGEYDVTIPRIAELHRMLAGSIIRKSSRLTGQEIAYLRKHFGLTSAELAARLGTTRETISRWENRAAVIGATADRLLRMLVAVRETRTDFDPARLDRISDQPRPMPPLKLQPGPAGWHPVAAAA